MNILEHITHPQNKPKRHLRSPAIRSRSRLRKYRWMLSPSFQPSNR